MKFTNFRFLFAWILAAALLALKSPDSLSNPQFWAEDGAVFFAQQFEESWPRIWTPYAGYLHCAPRLIAWLANALAPVHQPLFYNSAAITIGAFAIAYATWRFRSAAPIPVVFAAFFILPTAGDIFGTVTNIQWFLQFVVIGATLKLAGENESNESWSRKALRYLLLLVASITGPFSLLWIFFLSGLLGFRRLLQGLGKNPPTGTTSLSRVPIRWDNFSVVATGAVIQLTTLLAIPSAYPAAHFLSGEELKTLGLEFVVHPYGVIINSPWTFPHLALLAFMATTTAVAMKGMMKTNSWSHQLVALISLLGASQPALSYLRTQSQSSLASPSHYFFLWGVVSIWITGGLVARRLPKYSRLFFAALILLFLIGSTKRRAYFIRAPLVDFDWPAAAARIESGERGTPIPLNPPPWRMVIE